MQLEGNFKEYSMEVFVSKDSTMKNAEGYCNPGRVFEGIWVIPYRLPLPESFNGAPIPVYVQCCVMKGISFPATNWEKVLCSPVYRFVK